MKNCTNFSICPDIEGFCHSAWTQTTHFVISVSVPSTCRLTLRCQAYVLSHSASPPSMYRLTLCQLSQPIASHCVTAEALSSFLWTRQRIISLCVSQLTYWISLLHHSRRIDSFSVTTVEVLSHSASPQSTCFLTSRHHSQHIVFLSSSPCQSSHSARRLISISIT